MKLFISFILFVRLFGSVSTFFHSLDSLWLISTWSTENPIDRVRFEVQFNRTCEQDFLFGISDQKQFLECRDAWKEQTEAMKNFCDPQPRTRMGALLMAVRSKNKFMFNRTKYISFRNFKQVNEQ